MMSQYKKGVMRLHMHKCEHCGRLYDNPATIDYGDEEVVCLCPICGERTQNTVVVVEVKRNEEIIIREV